MHISYQRCDIYGVFKGNNKEIIFKRKHLTFETVQQFAYHNQMHDLLFPRLEAANCFPSVGTWSDSEINPEISTINDLLYFYTDVLLIKMDFQ